MPTPVEPRPPPIPMPIPTSERTPTPVPRPMPTAASWTRWLIPQSLLGLMDRPTRQTSKTSGSTVWGDSETVSISNSQYGSISPEPTAWMSAWAWLAGTRRGSCTVSVHPGATCW